MPDYVPKGTLTGVGARNRIGIIVLIVIRETRKRAVILSTGVWWRKLVIENPGDSQYTVLRLD